MSERVETISLPPARGWQAQGVLSHGLLFLSGLTASAGGLTHRSSVAAEVQTILEGLRAALAERDLTTDHLARVEAYLRDPGQLHEFLAAWHSEVGNHVPTTVVGAGPSGLVSSSAAVELDVTVSADAEPLRRHGRDSKSQTTSDDARPGDICSVVTGQGIVFLAGCMANDLGEFVLAPGAQIDPEFPFYDEPVAVQTDHVLANLVHALEAAGSSVANVVKAQVFLDRLEDFHAFDAVWGRYFADPPPRTTVQAGRLTIPDARVLVQLTAVGETAGSPVVDVTSDRAPAPMVNYSQGRRAGGLVFAAGQLASDFTTGIPPEASINPAFPFYGTTIETQTEFILDNIGEVLAAGNSGLDRVVKAQVLMRDLNELSGLERVWRRRFPDPPARTVVELGGDGLLVRGARVEIYVIAEEAP